uniref:FBA_2 domain-containing protein n=1 Tax=Caenorhabditis tropicalis TaxID=1561998 RepID=A0A1I7UTN3_9PELO
MLAHHLLDTFKKTFIHISFSDKTQPAWALRFMKMLNKRQASIRSFRYYIPSDSSEFIPRILDECTEVTDTIWISADFPDDFNYVSPRPFKATELHVGKTGNWMNLENFVNCRQIEIHSYKTLNWTPQSWNKFFRNWINSDAQLEDLRCEKIEESDFPLMVDGLSDEGIKHSEYYEWIEVKRRDGSEFVIGRTFNRVFIETRVKHLEAWWRQ